MDINLWTLKPTSELTKEIFVARDLSMEIFWANINGFKP